MDPFSKNGCEKYLKKTQVGAAGKGRAGGRGAEKRCYEAIKALERARDGVRDMRRQKKRGQLTNIRFTPKDTRKPKKKMNETAKENAKINRIHGYKIFLERVIGALSEKRFYTFREYPVPNKIKYG